MADLSYYTLDERQLFITPENRFKFNRRRLAWVATSLKFGENSKGQSVSIFKF